MTKFLKHRSERGFTLIELLVVIAIIGILSSVVLASLNSARVKARDARRVADLKQIQVAQELFYDANGYYANNVAGLVGGTGGKSLAVEPVDPTPGVGSYTYAYKGAEDAATAYHVGAYMEQAHDATTLDDGDVDLDTSATWINAGGSGGFDGSADTTADPWIYDVSNVGTP